MELLALAASALAALFAYLAWNSASQCSELKEVMVRLYRLMKRKDECLKPKAVLSLVEAARLLAEDARKLYEETGKEEFLRVAEKWEEFVRVNRKAVEKALGYEEGAPSK